MRRILLASAFNLLFPFGAFAGTVTVNDSYSVIGQSGLTFAVGTNTSVAAYTTAQNVATLFLSEGVWQCDGSVSPAAVASGTITVGISLTSGTLATSSTKGALWSSTVVTVNGTGVDGQAVHAGPAYLFVSPGSASKPVYLVGQKSASGADTQDAFVCVHLGN